MFLGNRLRKKFFKAFLFTLVGGLVLVGCALLVLRSAIRQPTVPAHAAQPFVSDIHFRPPGNRPAYDTVEPHPEDAYISISAPENGWTRRADFFTVLLFGYDAGRNTDTLMVAAFDAANQQAYIVSIPRDTKVDVQRNIRRVNSAYAVGRQGGGGHTGGVEQLRREVQTLIGFIPDFYICVEENAFRRIVDAVGGVYIDVPFHMYYTDPAQNLRINIPAGRQRLDGHQALHFVRYRYGNDPARTISDRRRMQNQQQLIAAMLEELRAPRTILRVPELINTYRDHVRTDLTLNEMLWFAEQFLTGNVTLHTYSYPTTSLRLTHWYEIPNPEEALALINRTLNPFTRDLTPDNLQLTT
ncbi:MAG: LCP family protein [Defluviitaleaceae bacterium]|nr:LCP family protein [Defluviitaleaceae bacterium]MCL2238847.1 LCP family protein [Defluviitaleaceae bacterium]